MIGCTTGKIKQRCAQNANTNQQSQIWYVKHEENKTRQDVCSNWPYLRGGNFQLTRVPEFCNSFLQNGHFSYHVNAKSNWMTFSNFVALLENLGHQLSAGNAWWELGVNDEFLAIFWKLPNLIYSTHSIAKQAEMRQVVCHALINPHWWWYVCFSQWVDFFSKSAFLFFLQLHFHEIFLQYS